MTKLKDLKARLLKDPEVREHYDAPEEEFALMAAVAKARALGLEPSRTCQAHEDDAEHDRTARKRPRAALDPHARPLRQGDGAPAEDRIRAGAQEGMTGQPAWSEATSGVSASPTVTPHVATLMRATCSIAWTGRRSSISSPISPRPTRCPTPRSAGTPGGSGESRSVKRRATSASAQTASQYVACFSLPTLRARCKNIRKSSI